MLVTKEVNKTLYTRKTKKKFNINTAKLKKNAVRVIEDSGRIKLDKNNKADLDWYFG